jgi:hypothetical protein
MRPLRFGATIVEAWRFVWDNRRDFFAFAYLPVIALAIYTVLISFAISVEIPADLSTISTEAAALLLVRMLLELAFGTVMYVVFAVPWHRLQLVGNEGTTVGSALRWRPRHTRFLARTAAIVLIYFALSVVLGRLLALFAPGGTAVTPIMFLLGLFVGLVLLANMLRTTVWLAAAAVEDYGVTFAEAWRLTRRCAPTYLALFFAALLPPLLVGSLVINRIVAAIGLQTVVESLPLRFVAALLSESVSFVALAVLTSAFSIAYRDLKAHDAGTV